MTQIIFNATQRQILTAAALAANEAQPQGNGFLHYDPTVTYTPDMMLPYWNNDEGRSIINCDYVDGRATKFAVWRNAGWAATEPKRFLKGGYRFRTGFETQDHYETWRVKYPTYEDLLKAAGITDYKVV